MMRFDSERNNSKWSTRMDMKSSPIAGDFGFGIAQSELALEKHNGTVDHRGVEAKQQAANRGYRCWQVHVTGGGLLQVVH